MPCTSTPASDGSQVRDQQRAGLLHHLAAPGVPDYGVFGFHVAAWQQPAVQSLVMDQRQPFTLGCPHQARTGNVDRPELIARESRRGALEEHQNQVAALERLAIVVGGEAAHHLRDGCNIRS